MRRVLHLKMVTQCAMLEEFGIFLVLADKVCQHDGVRVLFLTWLCLVSLRLSYRSSRAVIPTYTTGHPGSSKAQRHKRRTFLQCG